MRKGGFCHGSCIASHPCSGYVKAPPDKAFIISGYRKTPKILIGRAGVKIPFLERLDVLYLGQMTVDIKTEQSVPTTDFINVNVDAVAKVRIAPDSKGIEKASRNFLNKKPEQIAMDLQDSLQGNMREIIGTLTLKDINTNRDSLLQYSKCDGREGAHQRPRCGQHFED